MKFYPKSIAGRVFALLSALFILVLIIIISIPVYKYLRYTPEEGDIVFQSLPHNHLVNVIEGITQSEYSHCGIVVCKNGNWIVLEAIGPVKETPLFNWIFRGRNFDFAAYRFIPKYKPIIKQFINEGYKYLNFPYDVRYQMDDEKIYCSELVYKAFEKSTGERITELERLGDLNWKPYRRSIEYFENGAPPLDRKMITPVHLSRSSKLEKIY